MYRARTMWLLLIVSCIVYIHVPAPAEDDFHDVHGELVTIKANYYQLGIELCLPPGELQAVHQTFSQNIAQGFTEVLLMWLRQRYNVEMYGLPTWRRLVEAVDSPAGGNNPILAVAIANKHLVPGMITVHSSVCVCVCVCVCAQHLQQSVNAHVIDTCIG